MRSRSRCFALASRARLARAGALLLLCSVAVLSTGCFGSFPLTHKIYSTNQEISHVEFHQTLAYWAMLITLVYPGVVLTDMIVMNTIEFWDPEPNPWRQGANLSRSEDASDLALELPGEPVFPAAAIADAAEPETLAPVDAPLDPPLAPIFEAPGSQLPATPTVPLPLPALAPVPGDEPSSAVDRSLSQAWDDPALR
jgi:hypothetical protein